MLFPIRYDQKCKNIRNENANRNDMEPIHDVKTVDAKDHNIDVVGIVSGIFKVLKNSDKTKTSVLQKGTNMY